METVVISACLVGDKCRYDGKGKYNPLVKKILKKYQLLPVCPEVLGGLSTPRIRSEIRKDKVINEKEFDNTKFFKDGAKKALNASLYMHVTKAILTEKSPSCGVHQVYNGFFENKLIDGVGIFTSLLKENNIEVYTIEEFYEKFCKE